MQVKNPSRDATCLTLILKRKKTMIKPLSLAAVNQEISQEKNRATLHRIHTPHTLPFSS